MKTQFYTLKDCINWDAKQVKDSFEILQQNKLPVELQEDRVIKICNLIAHYREQYKYF